MKGYKALDMDMEAIYSNRMQYEMNKTYIISGEVILGRNGFHFCKKIEELSIYYEMSDSRIFEIEADGVIVSQGNKYAAEKIKLVKELTKEEIKGYFEQNQDELVKSTLWRVRREVAQQGYGLDVLVADEDDDVRRAVANQGYGLDILVTDEDADVRRAVAEQGYGLDVLVADEDVDVIRAVVEQGYGLDVLVTDEDADVRRAVAEQGYGLDILVTDEDADVRRAVANQGYGLDVLVTDEDWAVRVAVAKQGYGLERLVGDPNSNVRIMAQEMLRKEKIEI